MTTKLETLEAPITPLVPDTLSVWPDRESFLAWCRERGVKSGSAEDLRNARDRECLVARALQNLTGRKWSCGNTSADTCDSHTSSVSLTFPRHFTEIIYDFDAGRLPEFTE